jgi:hypothetical protein
MSQVDPESRLDYISVRRDEINRLAQQLGKTEEVFKNLSIPQPTYSCVEAGFLKSSSWLYTLYYESGRVNIDFLLDRLSDYSLDPQDTCRAHVKIVHNLRTVFQHHVDTSEDRDASLRQAAEAWMSTYCNTTAPQSDQQWSELLIGILAEADEFVDNLLKCIRSIGQDPFCTSIISDWNYRCSRYYPAYEFDKLISIVAADFGQDQLDPVRIRNRYYDLWAKELELLQGNYKFELEARKLIERALSTTPVLPITGEDIMRTFNIGPGPQIKVLYNKARALYEARPCTALELLERLKQNSPI